jgi:hypothetical protein
MAKKLYIILGVSENASLSEIQKAFRKKALLLHPDKHTSEDSKAKAEIEFKVLNSAHQILSDSESRKKYDAGVINDIGESTASGSSESQVDDYSNPEFIRIFASGIFTLEHLERAIRMVKADLSQIFYDNLSFINIINNTENIEKVLTHLAKTTTPVRQLAKMLNVIDEIKFQAVLKALAFDRNIIFSKESLVALLDMIKLNGRYEEVVFHLLLGIVKDNDSLEFIIRHQSSQRSELIIQLLQGRLLEKLEGPTYNIISACWKLGGLPSDVKSGRKIPFTLFGFSDSVIPNLQKLDPTVRISKTDDVGMVAEFSDDKYHLSFKDIINLQEADDRFAGRATDDLMGLVMDEKKRASQEKAASSLKEAMPLFAQKYLAKTAFFKIPDSNGMGYHGKGEAFNEFRARSFKTQ